MGPARKLKNGKAGGGKKKTKATTKAPAKRRGNPNIAEAGKPYRFKKGHKPIGRKPKGAKSLAKVLRDQMEEPAANVSLIEAKAELLDLDPKRTTIGATLALSIIMDAMNGKGQHASIIMDKVDSYLNQGLTKFQVVMLAERIVEVINQEVKDPQTKAVIAEKIMALIGNVEDI